MALLSRTHRAEVEALVRRIEKIETAVEPKFQEHFVNAMGFPNTVETFPHLEMEVTLPARTNTTETDGRPRRRARPPV